jgi:hypothetical protein
MEVKTEVESDVESLSEGKENSPKNKIIEKEEDELDKKLKCEPAELLDEDSNSEVKIFFNVYPHITNQI